MKLTEYTAWEQVGNEIVLHCEEGVIGLSFADKDILRLRFNQGETLLADPDKMVVENPQALDCFTVLEETSGLRVETGAVTLLVSRKPLTIEARTPDGRTIVKTKRSAFGGGDEKGAVLRLALTEKEQIYGLGQDPMGNVNQRGHERRMWNEWGGLHVCANAANPFCWSSKGYGLLLNSGWPARFAVGEGKVSDPPPAHSIARSKGPWEWGQNSGEEDPHDLSLLLEDGRMDVFLIFRPGEGAISGYTALTGAAPLPPKWALGYMQSKNRYRSSAEFLKLAADYRKMGIPCDVLVLDWLWFNQFGDMEWDEANWQNPADMLHTLHQMGFHVMQAYHPFIYEDSLKVKEFREKGFLMNTPPGTLPIFDHSSPEAREEWWRQTKKLAEQGIDAYWIDMGEPRDHPPGTSCRLGSREQVHNLYSNFWAKGLYEGHRRDLESRIFSLSRTSYAGIQRYGAALWSNDIDSSWEVLKDQVPAGLGVCLSGLPYWCTDIGGFATDDRFSAELFIRWMEWGVFCPLFRTHGTRPENEPWSYGEEAEAILTKFIRLRYRLLPYIYSCARAVTESGKPMMRALCLDFPDDETACAQKHEYLFGPSLLVAPVLDKDARSREVYLPRGNWYDFWTGEKLSGGRSVTAMAPLDRIPLYVREGAVIPMGEAVEYVGQKPDTRLEIHVYGGAPAAYTLYEDDGNTYAYEKGRYVKTRISVRGGSLQAEVIEGDASLLPAERSYQLVRHIGAENQADKLPFTLSFDQDLNTDGVCRVHLTADTGATETAFSYEMEAPSGWRLTDAPCYFRKTPLEKGTLTRRGGIAFMWEFTPIRGLLPLRNTAKLTLRVACGGTEKQVEHAFTWGSGCLNQADVIGFFDGEDPTDAAIMSRIESGDIRPAYHRGESMAAEAEARDDGELSSGGALSGGSGEVCWNRHISYNCWGYLDLRPMAASPMKNGRGTGYAKFRIYSDGERKCRFQYAAERAFTLWVNGEMVYTQDGIQLMQVPEETFTLRKGYNDCLVKCFVDYPKQMSGREIGFSLRILDENGEEQKGLLFE